MELINNKTIYDLVDEWNELVTECEKGYSGSIYEFDYDMQIRYQIQEKLISTFNNDEDLLSTINNIDNRLKEISTGIDEKSDNWWKNVVLKFGGVDYVESAFNELKIMVNLIRS